MYSFEKYTLRGIPREGEDGTGSGLTDASVSSSSMFSGISPLSAGTLGLGVLGFGSILGRGPDHLPPQYAALESTVPALQAEGKVLADEGATLTGQGTTALEMARTGTLTPEQQAQLNQYRTGLTNQARQQFANMGRNPDQDTAFINQTADIDAQVNAMAQKQIETTIQLGLGELSAGSSYSGQALGFANAANNALVEAGKAQIELDKAYSSSLTSAFTAIGQMFATVGKTALMAA